MKVEDYNDILQEHINLKHSIEVMEQTEGWQHLIGWILQLTKILQEKMLDCKLEEIDVIRGQIKGFIALLNYINECKLKGEMAMEKLEKKGGIESG